MVRRVNAALGALLWVLVVVLPVLGAGCSSELSGASTPDLVGHADWPAAIDQRVGDATADAGDGGLGPFDATPGADAGAPPCTAPTDRPLRLFFIGNSFTFGGSIPTQVDKLAVAAGFPDPDVEWSVKGGYTLEQHRALQSSVDGVAKGGWDVVVLQENSVRPTDALGKPAQFKLDATWFYDQTKAKSPTARVVLYETWARHADHSYYPGSFSGPAEMQAQLRKHYNDAASSYIPTHSAAAAKTDVVVSPVGDAWERHLAEPDPLRLHAADDWHAGENGQYLNALVLFSTIYGCKVSGLTNLKLAAADAARLQAAADATTGIVGVPPGSAKAMPVGAKVRVDFGALTTADPGWNNLVSHNGALQDAIDSAGQPTSVDVTVSDSFSGGNESGVSQNSLGWPQTVSRDTLWTGSFDGHAAALAAKAKLELSGLPAGSYTLELLSSRTGTDSGKGRLTRFTLTGSAAGSQSQDLDSADNAGTLVTFANVAVDASGSLQLEIAVSPAGQARFAYLNALTLRRVQ